MKNNGKGRHFLYLKVNQSNAFKTDRQWEHLAGSAGGARDSISGPAVSSVSPVWGVEITEINKT